jgi:hypothetical protein
MSLEEANKIFQRAIEKQAAFRIEADRQMEELKGYGEVVNYPVEYYDIRFFLSEEEKKLLKQHKMIQDGGKRKIRSRKIKTRKHKSHRKVTKRSRK